MIYAGDEKEMKNLIKFKNNLENKLVAKKEKAKHIAKTKYPKLVFALLDGKDY